MFLCVGSDEGEGMGGSRGEREMRVMGEENGRERGSNGSGGNEREGEAM